MNLPHNNPQTPGQRAAQQRRYEQAMALLRETSPAYEAASRFLLECVLNEPGNSIFVDAYLECWNRRYEFNYKGSFWRKFAPTYAWRQAIAAANASKIFAAGLELLQSNPWREDVLISLCDACRKLNCYEAADCYLRQGLSANNDSVELLRNRARLRAAIGDFDLAVEIWQKIQELSPGDTEAGDQLALLAPTISNEVEAQIVALRKRVEANLQDESLACELADFLAENGLFIEAEDVIAQAVASSGKSLKLLAELERLEIARLTSRVGLAIQRASIEPTDHSSELVVRLERELQNRRIEIMSQRVSREPDNAELKSQLALAFQSAERYREAVTLWEDIRRVDGYRSLACLQAGECLCHLQQFESAMTCFVTAIEAADGSAEIMRRALTRASTLAESTGRQELARRYRKELKNYHP